MRQIGVAELRRDLSNWLKRVQAGETIIVQDRETPIAQLSPIPDLGPFRTELKELAAQGLLRLPDTSELWQGFAALPLAEVSAEALRESLELERAASVWNH